MEQGHRGGSAPGRSTPAARPTRSPGPAPCRSSRRRASCSRTPPTPPTCSPCRSTATSTPASATRPSPRSRSGWPASRAASARWRRPAGSRAEFLTDRRAVRGRRPHRLVGAALRRHTHPARGHARPLRRRARRSSPSGDPADYARGDADRRRSWSTPRSSPTRPVPSPTSRASPTVAHAAGIPLVRRLDGGDAVPVPADRVGRRHRRPLGHEVPRRPRHVARRRRRRVGPLRLGQRQLPADDRAGRRRTAGCRGGATSASTPSAPACVPSSSATSAPTLSPFNAFLLLQGRGDAAAADGRPPRQRRTPSPSSSSATRRCRGCAGPGWPTTPTTHRAERYLPHGPGAVFSFGVHGGRDAGRRVHRVAGAVQPPGQHRRRAHARDPPGEHHAPAAVATRRSTPRACRPTSSASRSGSRTPTTSCGTSTRRWPRRRRSGHERRREPTWDAADRPGAAGDPAVDADGRDRRHVGRPEPGELLRRHVPAVVELRVRARLVRQPEGRRDPRPAACTRRSPTCPARPTSSTCSAAATTCRRSPRRSWRSRASTTFWAQLGLHSDEAVRIVTARRADVVMNRCLKIEHARFAGGLHLAGFDTGVISSKRRPEL